MWVLSDHCSLGKGMTYGHISSQIFVTRRFPDFATKRFLDFCDQAIPGFLHSDVAHLSNRLCGIIFSSTLAL
jgi:hypothetical protein